MTSRNDWQAEALCAQTDPDAFFPEKGGSVREAKRICAGCPVRAECLEDALANNEQYGVYGGLSERERRPLLNAYRTALDADFAAPVAEGSKRCRACRTVRPVDKFHRNSSMPDGRKASCKACCAGAQLRRPRLRAGALRPAA